MKTPTTSEPPIEKLKTSQREEAIARLRILEEMGLDPSYREAFEQDGIVTLFGIVHKEPGRYCSVCPIEDGSPVSLSGKPLVNYVNETEERLGVLVFAATYELTPLGEVLDLLFVGKHAREWERERSLLPERRALTRSCNLDAGWLSDVGAIGFRVSEGALARTS